MGVLALVMLAIVFINARLHYTPEKGDIDESVKLLKEQIERGADVEMQKIYPEGYVFMNALYTLSNGGIDAGEINKSIAKINSPDAKSTFNGDLPLPYGAFYNGWSSYVSGSELDPDNREEVDRFIDQCSLISAALSKETFPESYHGGRWPADATICVASLALHDKIFQPKYQAVIARWVSEVKGKLDKRGMIPHSPNQDARGSSMALMLVFLKDIDQKFAEEQFDLFKEHFMDTRFGLTGIREYPKGVNGTNDIDSGPVVMHFGAAATIVGMQTLSLYDEPEPGMRIRNEIDAVYPLGTFPMADAFITWGNRNMTHVNARVSFLEFHVYSAILFTILAVLFWKSITSFQ